MTTSQSKHDVSTSVAGGQAIGILGSLALREHTGLAPIETTTQAYYSNWCSGRDKAVGVVSHSQTGVFAEAIGKCFLAIRGHAVLTNGLTQSGSSLTHTLLEQYQRTGDLPVELLAGSFSIALLDCERRRAFLYRGIGGCEFTYFGIHREILVFGSNLCKVAGLLGRRPEFNKNNIVDVFIGRFPSGTSTLLCGIDRLAPGQLARIDADSRNLLQRTRFVAPKFSTFASAVEAVESTLSEVCAEHSQRSPKAVNLLSGGVDSSLIQLMLNRSIASRPTTAVVTTNHPMTTGDRQYAKSASRRFDTDHLECPTRDPAGNLLKQFIKTSGELPNHVQSIYFRELAKQLKQAGADVALCGQGADALFGEGVIAFIQRAERIARFSTNSSVCAMLSGAASMLGKPFTAESIRMAPILTDLSHPLNPANQAGAFTDWRSVEDSFGADAVKDALQQRRERLMPYGTPESLMESLHDGWLLHDSLDAAALWNSSCHEEGLELVFPFLDSRIIQLVHSLSASVRFSGRFPKMLLRAILAKHGYEDLAYREKLAFGQPVFEWMNAEGELRSDVTEIKARDYLKPDVLQSAVKSPNWFLYTALCLDYWQRYHVDN